MDSKDEIQKSVAEVLQTLHQKIDSIKEKVEKLCESTECFESLPVRKTNNETKKS